MTVVRQQVVDDNGWQVAAIWAELDVSAPGPRQQEPRTWFKMCVMMRLRGFFVVVVLGGAAVMAGGCGSSKTDDQPGDALLPQPDVVADLAPVDTGHVDQVSVDAGSDLAGDAPADGSADSQADEGGGDAGAGCSLGEATSEASATNLSLFGTPVFFNGGASIPAGKYVISYVDGCMKYGSGQGWTVNAYNGGCCSWWRIGESVSEQKAVLPGTIGYAAGQGAFANFEDCVTASRQAPAQVFDHPGGKIGVWLKDSPYSDNAAGEMGRNPKWRLSYATCTGVDAGSDGP